jgi:drug/metabolite transporter (DMT)-like permease
MIDAVVMVAVGILGGLGQIFLTESYRHAETSVIAPFEYSTMLWAVVIGFVLFGEKPATIVIAGAAIVILAGLFVLWRERRLGLDRDAAARANAPQRTV